MNIANRFKTIFLVLGDIVALYCSLFITLLARYGNEFYDQFVGSHFLPFTIIFSVWLLVFYVAGLYDLRRLRNNLEFLKVFYLTLVVNFVVAVFFFYLVPAFVITPKTNLFIFVVVFAIAEIFWRKQFNKATSAGVSHTKILLVGDGATAQAIVTAVVSCPQLGYEISTRVSEANAHSSPLAIKEAVTQDKINLVVVPRHLKNNRALSSILYELLGRGVEIRDFVNFYELILRKLPVSELEESWFIENLVEQQKFYDPLKRAWEFVTALILGTALLPLELLVAVLIKLTSRGPIIYRQLREGANGRKFVLYKFRTMYENAERRGPQWADSNDLRATPLGKILRYTHLDELPQLWNILKGEISFVGPRPERPEFVAMLKEKIPYYEIRHLIKPGVTGWAQINYKYGSSVEDAYEKLQYDIYYLKNRSLVLDLAIILKTLKSFFVNQK